MDKTFILHLIGFPGTGKLTVAQEFCRLNDDARLIDNHAINNPIFALIRQDGVTPIPESAWVQVRKIRAIILDSIKNVAPADLNFVMTNFLVEDDPEDEQIFNQVKETANRSGRSYIPVVLTCDLEENQRRIMDAGREKNMKMRDADGLAELRKRLTPKGQDHPNALTLDITDLQPRETTERIRAHVDKVLTIKF